MATVSLKSLDANTSSLKCVVDCPHIIYEYIFPTYSCKKYLSYHHLKADFLQLIAKDYDHYILKSELDNMFDCEGMLKIII